MDGQNNLDVLAVQIHFFLLGNAEDQQLIVRIGYDEHVQLVWGDYSFGRGKAFKCYRLLIHQGV